MPLAKICHSLPLPSICKPWAQALAKQLRKPRHAMLWCGFSCLGKRPRNDASGRFEALALGPPCGASQARSLVPWPRPPDGVFSRQKGKDQARCQHGPQGQYSPKLGQQGSKTL